MAVSKLYVGNLNFATTGAQLEEHFGQFGKVVSATIIGDKGFGFVEMSTPAEAQAAKDELDGQEFMGRVLKVDEARPPKQGGGGRGGFGGGRGGGKGGHGGGGGGRGGFGGGGGGRRW